MNRRKSQSRHSAMIYIALFLGAAIAAFGGIVHAYYKNRQVQVSREIDAIERRVGQYQLDIRTTQYRTDQLLHRFALREQLVANSSKLRPIPLGVVEVVEPAPSTRTSVAAIP
jgi:hypothetical protein